MPELIDSYVCAYQGDILLQGKMYITDRYLCFHSRIISYVTKHVYRWEQIENVTKERVAFIFPTAIGIQLKSTGKKIIYASFLQRDQAYDKILSICSRFNNDTNSYQDDDDNNNLTHSGTLKSSNSNNHRDYNEKMKKSKHNMNFEISDEPEQFDVLQMCLRQEKLTNNKRQTVSISSKSSDDKQEQQSKKQINLDKKKFLTKTSNVDQALSNNQSIGNSRSSKKQQQQQQQSDTNLQNSSVVYRQTHSTSLRTDQSHSRDRTLSPVNRSVSNHSDLNSSSNLTTNLNPIITDSNNDGLIKTYFRIIILSFISIINIIIEYLLLLYNQFKTYPIKTSLILLIFITILIIHSFYLIKLAYRIENRLQSLHHKWPSSSMKNSLPSLK